MAGWTINWNADDQAPLDFALMHLASKDDPWHVEIELAETNPLAGEGEHPFVTGYLRAGQADDGTVTVYLEESDDRGERTGKRLEFPAADVLSLDLT